jgi:hypothetical protein
MASWNPSFKLRSWLSLDATVGLFAVAKTNATIVGAYDLAVYYALDLFGGTLGLGFGYQIWSGFISAATVGFNYRYPVKLGLIPLLDHVLVGYQAFMDTTTGHNLRIMAGFRI